MRKGAMVRLHYRRKRVYVRTLQACKRGAGPGRESDSDGYLFDDDILSATDAGKWVSYVHDKLDTAKTTRKHTWVLRHDGLFFGSGWYEKEEAELVG